MPKNYARSMPFAPVPGEVYENHGGGTFRCLRSLYGTEAEMQNIKSGWTFTAHGCRRYQDNTIEWDYSTGGRFEKCS